MRQSVSNEIYSYWNSLRGVRLAPDRADIDPARIRHLLADCFIIEVDAHCLFPIRLCGSRVNALWLADQKGRSFLDFWRAEDRHTVAAALLTVIDGVVPVVAGASASECNSGRKTNEEPRLDLELVLLPLRNFGKTHSRLLGSISAARPADWFGRAQASPLQLKSLRVVRDVERRVGWKLPSHQKETPPRARQVSAMRGHDRTLRLTVYDGGKSL